MKIDKNLFIKYNFSKYNESAIQQQKKKKKNRIKSYILSSKNNFVFGIPF